MIGAGRPFCIIGERINPTGRKAFQAQLQAGDLSQLEIDVAEQVAGGADMLDVNVGDPLADEVELMRQAVPMVQGMTDLPLVIDSSVIEALEAGLAAYEGKALVNSVTGEDERLERILPIVAKHGAAVIGLANDDEIPMEPQRRLEVARKIVVGCRGLRHPAAGHRHRPAGDAGRRRAARGQPVPGDGAADPRRPRREHDLRRVEHVVRPARPPHPERRLPGRWPPATG